MSLFHTLLLSDPIDHCGLINIFEYTQFLYNYEISKRFLNTFSRTNEEYYREVLPTTLIWGNCLLI